MLEKWGYFLSSASKEMLLGMVLFGGIAGVLAIFLSPSQFLKVLKQETNGSYASIWHEYYRAFGIFVFFRGAAPYVLMQFLSSAAFGVSDYLSNAMLAAWPLGLTLEVFCRAILGAIFETIVTIKPEMTEIARNKKEFIKDKIVISTVLLAIFMRNTIFWFGGILAYKLTIQYSLSEFNGIAMALVMGIITSIISIPLDVVATKNCGAATRMGILELVAESYKTHGLSAIYAGTTIRIMQIIFYTVGNYATMRLLPMLSDIMLH